MESIFSTIFGAGFRKKTQTWHCSSQENYHEILVQSWNFDQNIGGGTDRLIYFPHCEVNSKLAFRLKKDKVLRVIKKPNFQIRVGETSRDIIYKQTCLHKIAPISWSPLFFWKMLVQIASIFHYCCICNSVIFAWDVARDSLSKHYVTDQPFMNETW